MTVKSKWSRVSQEGNDQIIHANLSIADTWDNLMVAFCIVGLRID